MAIMIKKNGFRVMHRLGKDEDINSLIKASHIILLDIEIYLFIYKGLHILEEG